MDSIATDTSEEMTPPCNTLDRMFEFQRLLQDFRYMRTKLKKLEVTLHDELCEKSLEEMMRCMETTGTPPDALFSGVLKWVRFDSTNRTNHLTQLMELLNLAKVYETNKYLLDKEFDYGGLLELNVYSLKTYLRILRLKEIQEPVINSEDSQAHDVVSDYQELPLSSSADYGQRCSDSESLSCVSQLFRSFMGKLTLLTEASTTNTNDESNPYCTPRNRPEEPSSQVPSTKITDLSTAMDEDFTQCIETELNNLDEGYNADVKNPESESEALVVSDSQRKGSFAPTSILTSRQMKILLGTTNHEKFQSAITEEPHCSGTNQDGFQFSETNQEISTVEVTNDTKLCTEANGSSEQELKPLIEGIIYKQDVKKVRFLYAYYVHRQIKKKFCRIIAPRDLSCTVLAGSNLYEIGGVLATKRPTFGDNTIGTNLVDIFNVSGNDSCVKVKGPAMIDIRKQCTAVIGGARGATVLSACERLNWTDSVAWEELPNHLNTCRESHALTVLNDEIYAIGGIGGVGSGSALGSVEKYNLQTQEWSYVKSLNVPRARAKAICFDEKIYVVGGVQRRLDSFPATNSVEVYDSSTNTWTKLVPMRIRRSNPLLIVTQNQELIAIGGTTEGKPLSMEIYDPKIGQWKLNAFHSTFGPFWFQHQRHIDFSGAVHFSFQNDETIQATKDSAERDDIV